jgi:Asp-tRNA(Asn)/Glu-tRNA(Gln) amidotransferase A subunit family amidase
VGRRHEPLERVVIATLRVEQETGEVIHGETVCRGNQRTRRVDRHIVEHDQLWNDGRLSCVEARELISAATDDAAARSDLARLESHLARCADCSAYADGVATLNRRVRISAPDVGNDFVARVMSRSRPPRLGRGAWLRPALTWCAIVIARDFQKAFETCDALITPVAPTTAFRIGEKITNPLEMYLSDVFVVAVNLAGIPALSVPCGIANGLPVGMQVMGPHLSEELLLPIGHMYQNVTDWHTQHPPCWNS